MLVPDSKFEGEVTAKGAVADYADGTADDDNEPSENEGRACSDRTRNRGRGGGRVERWRWRTRRCAVVMTGEWGQSGGDRGGIGEGGISCGEDREDLAGKSEKERYLLY